MLALSVFTEQAFIAKRHHLLATILFRALIPLANVNVNDLVAK